MNKNAIKKYAIWARRELIKCVSQRAMMYGITKESAENLFTQNSELRTANGVVLTPTESKQCKALLNRIHAVGFTQVMEEVAYTWFNRFAALRFMEVNGYLPSHVRVFTNDAGEFKPQILAEAIHLELDGLDMKKVYALENENQSDELFKYLLIVQCNALNSILPGMFQRIDDYTELLLPDNLLRKDSVIEQMVTTIPEEDWTDQVQIIGWLYQYYNTELKDKVFADLKKNIKITKENIPAATQLFTPDWIVHYMVENSLGRLWIERKIVGSSELVVGSSDYEEKRQQKEKTLAEKFGWKYYLPEAPQEPDVRKKLITTNYQLPTTPQELRVIDPCCGSGHILCVLFDILVRIYEDYGYTARETAAKIVENNLWGLDIDERAAQLSYFTVMMKARQYDRRFFTLRIQPHVYAIEESNGITSAPMHDMGLHLTQEEYGKAAKQAMRLVEEMHDAKEYGSIIYVTPCDWDLLRRFAVPRDEDGQLHLDIHGEIEASARLQKLINIGEALAQKYDAVVTNPPYMGAGGMGQKLTAYLQVNYPAVKSDLFSVVIQKMTRMVTTHGLFSYIAPQSVMFLSTQAALRRELLSVTTLISLLDLGVKAFDSGFGTATAVFAKGWPKGTSALCMNLTEAEDKETVLLGRKATTYISSTDTFEMLPGEIFSYACTKPFSHWFQKEKISTSAVLDCGIKTGSNNTFVRLWYEVSLLKTAYSGSSLADMENGTYRWFKYSQGGGYHRWYGAIENVVDLEHDAERIKRTVSKATYRLRDKRKYYLQGMVWPMVGTNNFSCRLLPYDVLPDIASNVLYCSDEYQWDLLAYMNSKVFNEFMIMVNPTVNYPIDSVGAIPYCHPDARQTEEIDQLCKENVELCKNDWDAFETSWDFVRHPLLRHADTIAKSYSEWSQECEDRFNQLKANEEELNRIFIDIYGLHELTPEVEDKDVTVRKADLQREIKSLISYAVGCMFGRYSLDKDGLVFAGGEFSDQWLVVNPDRSQKVDAHKSLCYLRDVAQEAEITDLMRAHFGVDADNIIPITDDEYFEDDIVCRFVKFVEVGYGKDTLEENLSFIANALGGKGSSREVIRKYFLNDFFEDHVKIYQKRPIYWLFDSGKKNGFKCLIYMHRYQPDTIARIRTDYVHEQQSRYRTAIADLEQRINGASTGERVKLNKKLTKLQEQATELRLYEEKIHHLADQMIAIDLDDGVKVNYAKFQDVLAKVK